MYIKIFSSKLPNKMSIDSMICFEFKKDLNRIDYVYLLCKYYCLIINKIIEKEK